nr:hypothetical protein [uncultured Bacteroides sp.]
MKNEIVTNLKTEELVTVIGGAGFQPSNKFIIPPYLPENLGNV